MKSKRKPLLFALVALVMLLLEGSFLVGTAQAIIGRPLTPFSYAGVARRTTRRAFIYGGAAYGGSYGAYPAAAPMPYYPPSPYYW